MHLWEAHLCSEKPGPTTRQQISAENPAHPRRSLAVQEYAFQTKHENKLWNMTTDSKNSFGFWSKKDQNLRLYVLTVNLPTSHWQAEGKLLPLPATNKLFPEQTKIQQSNANTTNSRMNELSKSVQWNPGKHMHTHSRSRDLLIGQSTLKFNCTRGKFEFFGLR